MHSSEIPTEHDEWKRQKKRRGKKKYGIERRYWMRWGRPAPRWSEWFQSWYATERARDTAYDALLAKKDLLTMEYRKIDR